MTTFCTQLSLPRKIEEYVDARDTAVRLLAEAEQLTNMASQSLDEFLPLLGLPYQAKPQQSLSATTKDIDRRFWRVTFEKAGFMQYMDKEAKAQFDRELEDKPPEFNIDNIRSVLISAASDAQVMFRRGLVNVFKRMQPYYVTNSKEAFKVDRKAILEFMFSLRWGGGLEVNYNHRAEINDIDRVFKVLAGNKHNPGELVTNLDQHYAEGLTPRIGPYEDDFYRIKGFKKGTMHIEFKRADLLEQANKLIAEHYADGALADGRHAA